jgi:hypothetical protein
MVAGMVAGMVVRMVGTPRNGHVSVAMLPTCCDPNTSGQLKLKIKGLPDGRACWHLHVIFAHALYSDGHDAASGHRRDHAKHDHFWQQNDVSMCV